MGKEEKKKRRRERVIEDTIAIGRRPTDGRDTRRHTRIRGERERTKEEEEEKKGDIVDPMIIRASRTHTRTRVWSRDAPIIRVLRARSESGAENVTRDRRDRKRIRRKERE